MTARASASAAASTRRARRRDWRTTGLYIAVLAREFRWTFAGLAVAVAAGTALFAVTPHAALGGARPSLLVAAYAAWMALFAQPPFQPPDTWYLALVNGLYPLVGFLLVGEGIVRMGMLIVSKQQGEKWWMKVSASTYRDHVVLCGLGHVGWRVLGHLLEAQVQVVAIEKDGEGRFVAQAKSTGAPVLVRDMKDDDALVEAGVAHARAIVAATNDDMSNLEVALDARRLNPRIRVVMRLFDQAIAAKIAGAFDIDFAFSSSALAAPAIAAMTMENRVLATYDIGGRPWVVGEVSVEEGSALAGRTVDALERQHGARVVSVKAHARAAPAAPGADTVVAAGDVLVVHAAADHIGALAAAARTATGAGL
ncbi:MAG TPA: NAD-binding protein [Myxococcota bacterium]|nr:NAD-binding protein [Myxococcota bacterium]